MNNKKNDLLWSISLVVISLATLIISLTNAFDDNVPEAVAIVLCVIILTAVCTLLYTSLKKWQQKL